MTQPEMEGYARLIGLDTTGLTKGQILARLHPYLTNPTTAQILKARAKAAGFYVDRDLFFDISDEEHLAGMRSIARDEITTEEAEEDNTYLWKTREGFIPMEDMSDDHLVRAFHFANRKVEVHSRKVVRHEQLAEDYAQKAQELLVIMNERGLSPNLAAQLKIPIVKD